MRRLLSLFDPLFRGAALVVKPHDGAIGEREIRDDEADAREQLAGVVLGVRETAKGGRSLCSEVKGEVKRPRLLLVSQ